MMTQASLVCSLIGTIAIGLLAYGQRLTVSLPEQGTIIGKDISVVRTQRINAYLGIPYAQPPIANLRFAAPVTNPLPSWSGVRNATDFAPGCIEATDAFKKDQMVFLKLFPDQTLEMNEDCLYLNVFVPHGLVPADGFAVMLWIHPGNFSTGNPALWNPYPLVFKQRVIVVTIAYRLNILGFFSTLDGEAPGNYGLMDQSAAMGWVKNNIQLFGGNPENICLFGHDAGAISISLHLISPYSRGLFHKAIIMSGNSFLPATIRTQQAEKLVLDNVRGYFGCVKNSPLILECLRRNEANALVSHSIVSSVYWGPLDDTGLSNSSRPFIPEDVRLMYEQGDFMQIPILTGYTEMEDAFDLDDLGLVGADGNITKEQFDQVTEILVLQDMEESSNITCSIKKDSIMDAVQFYYSPPILSTEGNNLQKIVIDMVTDKNYASTTILQADYVSRYVADVYVYRFGLKIQTEAALEDVPSWITVPHYLDLVFVWGMPFWANRIEWDSIDRRTSDIIMNLWTNFAKSSDPAKSSLYPIKWDQFSSGNPRMLIVDRYFNMSDSRRVDYKAFEFWNVYYPKLIATASACCNSSHDDDAATMNIDFSYQYLLFIAILHIIYFTNTWV